MEPISVTTQVAASPAAVYELVSDVTRMGEWSPETRTAEWLDGASGPAAGARFRGHNKRKQAWKTTCTVVAAEPGREFAFAVGSPDKPDTRWRYRFEPSGDGTQVTEVCEIVREPGAIGRFLTKLGTGVSWADRPAQLRGDMEETLRRLKAVAESG